MEENVIQINGGITLNVDVSVQQIYIPIFQQISLKRKQPVKRKISIF